MCVCVCVCAHGGGVSVCISVYNDQVPVDDQLMEYRTALNSHLTVDWIIA